MTRVRDRVTWPDAVRNNELIFTVTVTTSRARSSSSSADDDSLDENMGASVAGAIVHLSLAAPSCLAQG